MPLLRPLESDIQKTNLNNQIRMTTWRAQANMTVNANFMASHESQTFTFQRFRLSYLYLILLGSISIDCIFNDLNGLSIFFEVNILGEIAFNLVRTNFLCEKGQHIHLQDLWNEKIFGWLVLLIRAITTQLVYQENTFKSIHRQRQQTIW